MKIDFLYPDFTAYEVLKGFTQELASAFSRAGVTSRVIDLNNKEDVQKHLKTPPDYTLAFNGLLPDVNGKFLYDFTGVPHMAWLLDHPERFLPLMNHPKTKIAVIDKEHLKVAKRTHAESYFLPHAIDPFRKVDREKERTLPILFPASFVLPKNEEEIKEQDARSQVLKTLKGFSLTVAGKGGEGKGSDYLGEVEWGKIREVFEKTKIVLQVTPKITNGSHERVFEALLAGALPVSTPNKFLEEEFPSIPQFHSSEELLYWVDLLLNNEEKRCQRVNQALPRLLSHHSWDQRVKSILEIISL